MIADIGSWFIAFGKALPSFIGQWLAAWIVSFLILIIIIRLCRRYLAQAIKAFDAKIRHAAHRLRYKSPTTPTEHGTERVALTWFFRFWTNFGSSPSLTVLSFIVPIVFYINAPPAPGLFRGTNIWLMPGICFGGGILLSFWIKRCFKRARPARKKGAFGHKMRDHSFPSGHSLTSLCFWMMIIPCLFSLQIAAWVLGILSVVAVCIVVLIGSSRVYLAVHWPSDIIGGYAIGAVWTVICYAVLWSRVAGSG